MTQRSRSASRAVALAVGAALALAAGARAQKKRPLTGYEVGPRMDKVVPGKFVIDPPTLENLGFRWYIQGDSNRNASVTVTVRKKGETEWRPALPMLRVHHEIANQDYGPFRCGNLFAGSVMFLAPATAYEVRFEMRDPDGGAAPPKVVTAKTRGKPRAPTGGRTLHAFPKGHEGDRPAGSILGVKAAYARAKPGDILLLHAGVYDEGTLELTRSGEPGRPIVFRGAADGEAVLQGKGHGRNLIEMAQANHVWFEDLTFRRARTAIFAGRGRAGSRGLVVRRCKIEDVISGIWSTSANSANWYIADCVLIGTNRTWYPRPKAYMSPSHTGVNVLGQGIVVCHNRISRFSDALAIANQAPRSTDPGEQCVAVDFYNNDLSWAQDDAMEADYGCHNIRVYRNRCYNAHTGLSVQPSYGGPIYLIRNEVFGVTALSLKLHNYCTGLEIYHNTLLTAGQGFQSFYKWQNGILRNNLILGRQRYAVETGSITPYTSLDYNGYRRTDDPDRFIKWYDGSKWGRYLTLKEFTQAAGHEPHGILVDYDAFVRASRPDEGKTSRPSDLDLRLKRGAAPVDAGCVLPNVNENFTGKAPDLGCHEVGEPAPYYGPRPQE
jgi:hypothetical protein